MVRLRPDRRALSRAVRCVAGEALRAGWPPVLALLEGVPGGGDGRAVGAAFQAVQLLAADHLAALPLPLLAPSLRCAALYASQQARALFIGCSASWLQVAEAN